MSFLSGIGNTIARFPVPAPIQKFMLATSKEGPASILLPESAVFTGRTAAAYHRDGVLGAQERGPEELITAMVWLYGVKWLAKGFDKYIKPWIWEGSSHLPSQIAWTTPFRKPAHVDLNAQEMFSRGADELKRLSWIKGWRLFASTGVALALAAYIIPKLNVLKTNWVIKHFYKKNDQNQQPEQKGAVPPFGATARPLPADTMPGQKGAMPPIGAAARFLPADTAIRLPEEIRPLPDDTAAARFIPASPLPTIGANAVFTPSAPFTIPNTPGFYNATPALIPQPFTSSNSPAFPDPIHPLQFTAPRVSSPIQSLPAFGRPMPQPAFAQHGTRNVQDKLRFGFLAGPGGGSIIQGLGHLIEQTPYGSVLVVDAGLTSGRTMVAYEREPLEAPEKIFQELASLYFYILVQPHVMTLMSKLIDPAFGTSILVEPSIAEELNRRLASELATMTLHRPELKEALSKGRIPLAALEEAVKGSSHKNTLMQPSQWLTKAMRNASLDGDGGFIQTLERELRTFLPDEKAVTATTQTIRDFLSSGATEISTGHIQGLMDSIYGKQGAFAKVSGPDRVNLTLALKNAFRHTVGLRMELTEESLQKFGPLSKTLEQLPAAEQKALLARLMRAGRIDAWDQANTMLRRSLNLARNNMSTNPDSVPLSDAGRTAWLQEAAKRKMSVETLATEKTMEQVEAMADWLDRVVNSHLTPEEMITQEIGDLRDTLANTALSDEAKGWLAKPEAVTPEHLRRLEESLEGLAGQKSWNPFQLLARRRVTKGLERLKSLNAVINPAILTPGETAGKTLAAIASENLGNAIRVLYKNMQTNAPQDIKDLLRHYRKRSQALLNGNQGRLFSMVLSDADTELAQKLKEILVGGLQNDSAFVRKAQSIVGQFEPDSRHFANPAKRQSMRNAVNLYMDRLLAKTGATADGKLVELKPALEHFFGLNRGMNYIARFVALGVAMFGLGILVPKVQFALTRMLTGKNENPGIAHARNAAGLGSNHPHPHNHKTAPSASHAFPVPFNGTPLHRNNFRSFQQRLQAGAQSGFVPAPSQGSR